MEPRGKSLSLRTTLYKTKRLMRRKPVTLPLLRSPARTYFRTTRLPFGRCITNRAFASAKHNRRFPGQGAAYVQPTGTHELSWVGRAIVPPGPCSSSVIHDARGFTDLLPTRVYLRLAVVHVAKDARALLSMRCKRLLAICCCGSPSPCAAKQPIL